MFNRKIVALATGALLATAGTVAFATQATEDRKEKKEKEAVYHSTIQVDPRMKDAANLARASRISAEHAARVAAGTDGKATEVELENEEGNLVYAVEVRSGNTAKEVIIDAGDGRVLSSEAEDEDDEARDDEEDEDEND